MQDTQQSIIMQIDWSWRFQNMRYHTLFHVIAGYLYQHYNALATSSQIENDHARLELAFSPEIIEKIPFEQLEQSIKNLLAQPHNVHTKTISRREAEPKEGTIKTNINLLPATLNEIRIIQIDNIDEQACGGTYVNNIDEIKGKGQKYFDKMRSGYLERDFQQLPEQVLFQPSFKIVNSI